MLLHITGDLRMICLRESVRRVIRIVSAAADADQWHILPAGNYMKHLSVHGI